MFLGLWGVRIRGNLWEIGRMLDFFGFKFFSIYLWCLLPEQANSDIAHSRMNQYSFWNIFVTPGH